MKKRNTQILRKVYEINEFGQPEKVIKPDRVTSWIPRIKSFQENGKIGSTKYPHFLSLKSTRILDQRKFDFLHIQL